MYIFRNLPCNENEIAVVGKYTFPDGEGFGVLEWCYDLEDANKILEEMKKDPNFSDLRIVDFSGDNEEK